MNDAEPLDLDAMTQRALAAERVLEYGPYERVDWVARYSTDVPALIAEVRRLRELQEDTAAENARLSAWWHAMRRGGLA